MDDAKTFRQELEDRGYDVVPTRSGHYRVEFNGHTISTMSSTPGDRRAMMNARSQVKRFERTRLDQPLNEGNNHVPDPGQDPWDGARGRTRPAGSPAPGTVQVPFQQRGVGGGVEDRRAPQDPEGPDRVLPERDALASVAVREPRSEELAARIKQAIIASGLKQRAIAEKTGIDYFALSRIVHGKRRISSLELALIADVTGTSVEDILNLDGPPVQVRWEHKIQRPAPDDGTLTAWEESLPRGDQLPEVREQRTEPLGEEVTYIVQRSPEGTLDWEDWMPSGQHEQLARRRYEDAARAATGYRLVKRTVIISDEVIS
jgi:transcriptional regulator with XRE-family HTH domain